MQAAEEPNSPTPIIQIEPWLSADVAFTFDKSCATYAMDIRLLQSIMPHVCKNLFPTAAH